MTASLCKPKEKKKTAAIQLRNRKTFFLFYFMLSRPHSNVNSEVKKTKKQKQKKTSKKTKQLKPKNYSFFFLPL